jgi:hypothetical protein
VTLRATNEARWRRSTNDGNEVNRMSTGGPAPRFSRERASELVSAASYGSVLVLAAIPLIHVVDVASGWGWELVTGVGVATWVAHLFAEVLGEQVRHGTSDLDAGRIRQSMVDGLPIPLAALFPAVVLGLGGLDVLDEEVALWLAFGVALVQLIGVGAFVGRSGSGRRTAAFAVGTAIVGGVIGVVKLLLSH